MSRHLLRGGGASLVVDAVEHGAPRVLHWGADLGDLADDDLAALAATSSPALPRALADAVATPSLLPSEVDLWRGRPGLSAHRGGRAVHPRWLATTVDHDGGLLVTALDEEAEVAVTTAVQLDLAGVVTVQHTVTNASSSGEPLDVAGVLAYLPVPHEAAEVLDLTGRWCRERSPQRSPWHHGGRVRESRRGRTGHDATLVLALGTPGFGFRSGEVWAAHVAWSGDHVHLAERHADGGGTHAGLLGGGELLRPGEVRLVEPGESYEAPAVHFAWSDAGLDGISAAFHDHLRSRLQHPRRPRPVTLNSWEAVYFDHDLDRLTRLAEAAARVGVERFVLDDGWFGGRRDETAGLGDWTVSPEAWPAGLRPLVDTVTGLGMEFGLWVEPEMVSPDSDLARAHPDWVLASAPADDPARLPPSARHQQVLDLTNPKAWEHVLDRLDTLVAEHGVHYLKWDHNRDLVEAVHADGRSGVHEQTRAVYRLLDELRRRHPGLEVESCSSGGARVDLGVLARTDRVWASDSNDAVERQVIQRWTGLLLPPELVGCHVGPPVSHTSGRAVGLGFRCLTAFFGHAGIEWDLTRCDDADLARLRRWVSVHREHRALLHGGVTVRADDASPGSEGQWLHGVVAPDRSAALYAFVQLTTSPDAAPGRHRLPGLDPGRRYRVEPLDLTGDGLPPGARVRETAWLVAGGTELPGAVLGRAGLPMPALHPQQGLVLHARAVA